MIQLFLMPITEAEKLSENYCLSNFPNRYSNSISFYNINDKMRSLCAGYLCKNILNIYEEKIHYTNEGKPYCLNKFFNISHSGNYTLLGVFDSDIGVDIEILNSRYLSLIDIVLTNNEKQWISDNPLNKFFCLWTAKESLLKYLGTGIVNNLKTIDVLPSFYNSQILYKNFSCYIRTIEYDNHVISVSVKDHIENINIYLVTLDNCLNISNEIKYYN